MRKRAFLRNLGTGLAAGSGLTALSMNDLIAADAGSRSFGGGLKPGEVQHMVIFNLKHEQDSAETQTFLRDAKRILTAIPGVQRFEVFRQVSPKNDYDFGFSMVFSGKADYENYNKHPDHVAFVEQRWKKEVSRFLEIDFEAEAV